MTRLAGSSGAVSRRLLAALLVVLAVATVAGARVRRPISLRIEWAFDTAPEGARPLRTITVQLGKGPSRELVVTKIINQGSGPLGATILDEVVRYKPSFRLIDGAQVEKLASAPAGRAVTITGSLTSGRNVLVSSVEVAGG